MVRTLIKKTISIFIIISLSLMETLNYAAIVSDNDGAAFVTKSEFEALKNNFASQVTNYSDSIDKKIDGAIASYLAGVKTEQKLTLDSLLNKINDACTDSYLDGTTETKYGYRCMAKSYTIPTTQKPVGAIVNLFMGNFWSTQRDTTTRWGGGWARLGMTNDTRTGLGDVSVPSSDQRNGIYLMLDSYQNRYYPVNKYSDFKYRYYVTGNAGSNYYSGIPVSGTTNTNVLWNFPAFRVTEDYWTMNFDDAVVSWEDNEYGGGPGSYDAFKVLYGPNYESTDIINVIPVVGSIDSTAKALCLLNDNVAKMREQESAYNWNLYGNQCFYLITQDSTSTWSNDVFLMGSSNPTVTFYFNCHPYEEVTLSNLIDYNATLNNDNTNVAIYGGLPVFKTTSAGEVTMKIKFKSKENHDVIIGLQKSQFANNATYTIDSSLNLRDADDNKYTSNRFAHDTEYTFVMDVEKDDTIWIKTYDASSNTAFTGAVTSSIELVSD